MLDVSLPSEGHCTVAAKEAAQEYALGSSARSTIWDILLHIQAECFKSYAFPFLNQKLTFFFKSFMAHLTGQFKISCA